ncbi:hypothetical protein CCC_02340 [Paramagnetospirillum magnetotacticum MS-1]|uniref:Uncharacterized protein n=1 Tax=Paramagnetospirillum magnetotacticum MS-1 TaxID=272627 RepID=A0A0C2YW07_PARME|nr:hypothetical protein [Paramagnetospirillum magnetotacticum]KIL98890.1 hypothetical protein CCC_02340 [Paramagnetospirillum magnetotacticum MS-1]
MVSLSVASSNLLLNKKENEATHSIEKSGSASAFSNYGYGPLDLPDGNKDITAEGTGTKPVSGTSSIAAVSSGASAQWLAQLAASMNPR